jgi:outer membrane protein OmpA-like peptidoglycan-associated protein
MIACLLCGALLSTVGCATKTFVREEVQKSETKLNQQVGKIESELGQEKNRVDGVQSQVAEVRSLAETAKARGGEASAKAEEAATKAEQATGVAGQAMAKAESTDSRLNRLWSNRNKRNLVSTVVITFGFDRWELDDGGQTTLLGVAKQLKENPNLIVDLTGYTDNAGPVAYNLQLSQRRVEAVRRFLVRRGVELHRIQSIGLGNAQPVAENKSRQGRAQNRRVEVRLFAAVE